MLALLYTLLFLFAISAQLPLFMLKQAILKRKLTTKEILKVSGVILASTTIVGSIIFFILPEKCNVLIGFPLGIGICIAQMYIVIEKI